MSLNGTVWVPIGPSPMQEGSGQDNGLVTAIAVNPEQQQRRLPRHGAGRRVAQSRRR